MCIRESRRIASATCFILVLHHNMPRSSSISTVMLMGSFQIQRSVTATTEGVSALRNFSIKLVRALLHAIKRAKDAISACGN